MALHNCRSNIGANNPEQYYKIKFINTFPDLKARANIVNLQILCPKLFMYNGVCHKYSKIDIIKN